MMGDRYIIVVDCPQCGHHDDDVYFAPTCGFTEWECEQCSCTLDLEEYTGITYEDASNRDMIERLIQKEEE